MFGASKNRFTATFRAYGYAYAPMLFFWVPCINIVAWLYFILQLIFGIQSLQETTLAKASAIVLTPMAIGICCCLPVISFFGMGASMLQRMLGS